MYTYKSSVSDVMNKKCIYTYKSSDMRNANKSSVSGIRDVRVSDIRNA